MVKVNFESANRLLTSYNVRKSKYKGYHHYLSLEFLKEDGDGNREVSWELISIEDGFQYEVIFLVLVSLYNRGCTFDEVIMDENIEEGNLNEVCYVFLKSKSFEYVSLSILSSDKRIDKAFNLVDRSVKRGSIRFTRGVRR